MQEKRNIRLSILLGVLTLITIAMYFFVSDPGEIAVDKNLFKVEDLKTVDRVVLSRGTETIELQFNGARWRVNDQLANADMIDVLFATLQQVEPKRPVASQMVDSVNALLTNHGVTVRLFEGQALQKEFIAGGNAATAQAYFKSMEDDEVYVMVIPGYRVYAAGIFELDENGWKDKYVFNFNWKNFKQLKATFPASPESNFEIEMGKEYFEVKGLPAVDTTRLNDFLDAISLTTVERYLNRDELNFDSLLQVKPQFQIEVSDIAGKKYTLALYETSNPYNTLGLTHDNQPAYLSKQKVSDLFKDKRWFIKK